MAISNAIGPLVIAVLQPSLLHASQNSVFMCGGVKFSRHSSAGASWKITKKKNVTKRLCWIDFYANFIPRSSNNMFAL